MAAHIYLVGFMGSGKSYWGKRLAEHLERPFFDLDEVIEIGEGQAVAVLFSSIGESGFRDLERRYLQQMERQPPAVIATGGGTPCFFDNMDWMNAHGTTVYLKISMPILFERLEAGRARRPLLAGLSDAELFQFIETLLAKRAVFYQQATATVERGPEDADAAFWEDLVKQSGREF
jgi:shikimate kinase